MFYNPDCRNTRDGSIICRIIKSYSRILPLQTVQTLIKEPYDTYLFL